MSVVQVPSDSWANWEVPPVISERLSTSSTEACSAVVKGKLSKAENWENVFYSPHRTKDDDEVPFPQILSVWFILISSLYKSAVALPHNEEPVKHLVSVALTLFKYQMNTTSVHDIMII